MSMNENYNNGPSICEHMRKVHLYIDGRVKAVGYRAFILRAAGPLGVKGYVRNMEGGVEVVAEGDDDQIEQLIEAARQGPPAAQVTNVTVDEQTPNFIYKDFTIRP